MSESKTTQMKQYILYPQQFTKKQIQHIYIDIYMCVGVVVVAAAAKEGVCNYSSV